MKYFVSVPGFQMKLPKQDQDNSTFYLSLTVKGVEMISDLDIVEPSSIDYTCGCCLHLMRLLIEDKKICVKC